MAEHWEYIFERSLLLIMKKRYNKEKPKGVHKPLNTKSLIEILLKVAKLIEMNL